jgi:hypothetical protein
VMFEGPSRGHTLRRMVSIYSCLFTEYERKDPSIIYVMQKDLDVGMGGRLIGARCGAVPLRSPISPLTNGATPPANYVTMLNGAAPLTNFSQVHRRPPFYSYPPNL